MGTNNLISTAIVCAYNEAQTLGAILESLSETPEVSEIIVVNDGSSDGTYKVINKFSVDKKIRAIEFSENRGKGYAMAEGIAHAIGSILIFVDSDLLNFKPEYISQLVRPLIEGKADMVIGDPTISHLEHRLDPLKVLSGERAVFKQDILSLIDPMRKSRFGVETLINLYYRAERKRVLCIPLWGVIHPMKIEKKYPLKKIVSEYSQASYQIAKTVVVHYWLIVLIVRNALWR